MTINWDQLRKRIYDKKDLALFDEAVKCYQCAAYRMAYIAIWITIAESLRNKISTMAQKDNHADEILKEIDRLENEHKATDRPILENAKVLGTLNDADYQQIEHILIMRNIYAHPYNVGPVPQEVELAFTHAIEKVLSVPPLLRKPYIDYLLENLEQNRHFIDDLEEKVVKFAKDITTKIAPNLYPYTLKGLFYRLNGVLNDPDKKIFQRRLIWFARMFAAQIKPNFAKPEWRLKDKFNDFPQAVTQILSDVDLWGIVPEDIQDGILGWLLYPEEEVDGEKIVLETSGKNVQQAFILYINKRLTQRQEERFLKWVEEEKIGNLGRWGIPLEYYVDKVNQALSSHNWYTQNPATNCVWNLGPSGLMHVPEDKLELLGRNILQSADGLAHDSMSLLKNSLENNIRWPKSFIKGVLYESFLDEALEYRCKHRCLHEGLLVCIRCCSEDTKDLFEKLISDIDSSTPKFGDDFEYGEKESIVELDKVIAELQGQELDVYKDLLLRLREELCS